MVLFFFAISIIYGSLFKKLRGREKKKKENENLRAMVLICFELKLALQFLRSFYIHTRLTYGHH